MKDYTYKCVPVPEVIDTVTSSQKPGCLPGLFGSKAEIITFKMLVFRKEK